jgi:Ribonuclease G/E
MTAPDAIIVERGPGETRAALLVGEDCLEVVHFRDGEAQPGDVFIGRVGERLPGGGAMFVDIGVPPHGVLEIKSAALAVGSHAVVEVLTPARADKGHKLKRGRLIAPAGSKAPTRLQAAAHPVQLWWQRYGAAVAKIVIDPRGEVKTYRSLLGEDAPLAPHDGGAGAFAHYGIDEQIEAALERRVGLPGGGALHIEPTAALVAVDVDAGAGRIEAANRAAVSAIARQIRLRNVAGAILIDFIAGKDKRKLMADLKALLAADPIETRVTGLTPSGLVEVVRRRVHPSLAEVLWDRSAGTWSVEAIAYRALRLACRELAARRGVKLTLRVAPAVAACLNERLAAALAEARRTSFGDILVAPREGFAVAQIDLGA